MKFAIPFFSLLLLCLLSSSSCHNEIPIEDTRLCYVDVTVSLSDFFSCYSFTDTKHASVPYVDENNHYKRVNATEIFNSLCTYDNHEYGIKRYAKIKSLVLFYDDRGLLVDSIVDYSDKVEEVNQTVQLAAGKYTAIATLIFRDEAYSGNFYWTLKEPGNLSTVYMENKYPGSIWSIMSYASQEIVVGEKNDNKVKLTPAPVGSLCYAYFQNFQNNDRIDKISVSTDYYAEGYRLDPSATEKFIYSEGAKEFLHPFPGYYYDTYPETRYFKSDVMDYFYILAPQSNIKFSYYNNSTRQWWQVEVPSVEIKSGTTYLSYWDYSQPDTPYFGVADNSHWHQ